MEQARKSGGPPSEVWSCEGRIYPYTGLNAVAGKKPEEFGTEPTRYDEMIPGCYDRKARLADMDVDGVEEWHKAIPSYEVVGTAAEHGGGVWGLIP